MKVKTNQLIGKALDWAVIQANGWGDDYIKFGFALGDFDCQYTPSTNWSQGGPLVEREKIDILCDVEDEAGEATNGNPGWIAQQWTLPLSLGKCLETSGPTPLIAAMRCYVTHKLGEKIEVPNGLLKT